MEAAGVNQTHASIDVNVSAGTAVELRVQPVTADSIIWGKGSYFDLSQLPTAVAPVVNTVAEYGEQNITNGTTLTSTVDADVATGGFTLPSAGTWEIAYNIMWTNSGNQATEFTVTDSSNTVIPGSDSALNVSGRMMSYQVFRTTTTGPTALKLRGKVGANTTTIQNAIGGFTGNSKIIWNKIAGQLPSTGTTVDKLHARQTTTQGGPSVGTVMNLEGIVSGNIPFASNTATLEAGKAYLLEGVGGVMAAGSSAYGTRFFNVTTGQFFGESSYAVSPNNTNSQTFVTRHAVAEITPTVTTQVQLRVDFVSGSVGTIGGSNLVNAGSGAGSTQDPNGATWVRITQIGSTSNTVGTLPALDQSSAGYFDIGNMRMQWGTGNTSGVSNVALPAAFANTSYVVTATMAAGSTSVVTTTGTKTTTTFQVNSFFAPDGGPSGSVSFNYFAIGQKP